jgi:uncharacterized protein YpmS
VSSVCDRKLLVDKKKKNYYQRWLIVVLVALLALVALTTMAMTIYVFAVVEKKTTITSTRINSRFGLIDTYSRSFIFRNNDHTNHYYK